MTLERYNKCNNLSIFIKVRHQNPSPGFVHAKNLWFYARNIRDSCDEFSYIGL